MNRDYQSYSITWQNIAITLRWAPEYFQLEGEHITAHLEIRAENKTRLPITSTGYYSHFIHRSAIDDMGGPAAYVRAWLDEAAQTRAWTKHVEESRQLCLF